MAQPTTYNRLTSFTNYQAVHPTSPLPGASVDAELNAIKLTLDELLANIALIQRDDTELQNEIVGRDQLMDEVPVGFNKPVVWETATAYTTSNTVYHNSGYYSVLISHTSGVFATDLAAAKLELIMDVSDIPLADAVNITFTPAGNIAATDVQAAIEELDTEKAALSHTHLSSQISDTSVDSRSIMTAANLNAIKTILGITGGLADVGDLKDTTRLTAPTGWLFCYGQAVSRTTYSTLFASMVVSQNGSRNSGSAVITGLASTTGLVAGMPVGGTGIPSSTTILSVDSATQITLSQNASTSGTSIVDVAPWGVGDGSTTFNLPDFRGRSRIGRDDMGGSAASRLTSGSAAAIAGTRVGATGGSQIDTLTTAKIPQHLHAISLNTASDGAHAHTAATLTTILRDAGDASGDNSLVAVDETGGGAVTLGSTITVSNAGSAHLHAISGNTGNTGSGDPHNNVQPVGVVNTIIYTGVS